MSRLCRLKTASHGDDGRWAYQEITSLRQQLAECERERDELVDALKQIVDVSGFDAEDRAIARWEIAESALAKAERREA